MITIYDNELFQFLKVSPVWDSLFTHPVDDCPELKNPEIPTLQGLDHIETKKDAVIFHDRGLSKQDGTIIDNTFQIKRRSRKMEVKRLMEKAKKDGLKKVLFTTFNFWLESGGYNYMNEYQFKKDGYDVWQGEKEVSSQPGHSHMEPAIFITIK